MKMLVIASLPLSGSPGSATPPMAATASTHICTSAALVAEKRGSTWYVSVIFVFSV